MAILFNDGHLLGRSVLQHESDLWVCIVIVIIISLIWSTPIQAPGRWRAAMGLYMLGFISYGATLVFYAALFPRLARNTPHARALREKYENGEISAEVYEKEESLEKNRISNISTVNIFPLYLIRLTKRISDAQ